ncbi:MAG: YkgJ family cysteine cluster protein [Planctomycetes bacterium]|nr:YkgJ family cysteine cluster protein [Planctomycetota bacterium]
MNKHTKQTPHYERGLAFECQKDCCDCCGGGPGYVWLEDEDVSKITKHLGISEDEFLQKYTKDVDGRLSFKDLKEDNWNCIMLKNGRCTIYELRPIQCRTYPFWAQNIISADAWQETKEECPGIGKGRVYSIDEILSIVREEKTIDTIK